MLRSPLTKKHPHAPAVATLAICFLVPNVPFPPVQFVFVSLRIRFQVDYKNGIVVLWS